MSMWNQVAPAVNQRHGDDSVASAGLRIFDVQLGAAALPHLVDDEAALHAARRQSDPID